MTDKELTIEQIAAKLRHPRRKNTEADWQKCVTSFEQDTENMWLVHVDEFMGVQPNSALNQLRNAIRTLEPKDVDVTVDDTLGCVLFHPSRVAEILNGS